MLAIKCRCDHLVNRRETFFGSHAVFDLELVFLLVPCLILLVMPTQEVGAYLVVEHAHYSPASVLARHSHIDLRLAQLRIVGATRRRHLVRTEGYNQLVLKTQIGYVLCHDLLGLFL